MDDSRLSQYPDRPTDKLRTIIATETRTYTHLETVTTTEVYTVFTTVSQTVVVETQTITTTSIASVPSDYKLRRQLLTAVSDYPAASISSACVCLKVRNCNNGKKGTTTLAAATETSVASTVVIDTTETSTATEAATTTVETTVTSPATATTVVNATPSAAPASSRLVFKNESGNKFYFKSIKQTSGDMIVLAADASDAVDTFQLDNEGHLSFISADYNGQLVYPYFATLWFSNSDPTKLLFNTAEYIDNWDSEDWYHYQWVADPNTGALTVTNAGNTVYSQLCLQGINENLEQELMLGTAIGLFCIPATVSLELA